MYFQHGKPIIFEPIVEGISANCPKAIMNWKDMNYMDCMHIEHVL